MVWQIEFFNKRLLNEGIKGKFSQIGLTPGRVELLVTL
jgi:hypothetical protein